MNFSIMKKWFYCAKQLGGKFDDTVRNEYFVAEKSEMRGVRGVDSDKFSHMISSLMESSLGWKGIQKKKLCLILLNRIYPSIPPGAMW